MPKVVNAKLLDGDVIALNRKLQELGYDTVGQFLRDFARGKVYLSRTKGIPLELNYVMLARMIAHILLEENGKPCDAEGVSRCPMVDWAGFEPATSRLRSEHYYL